MHLCKQRAATVVRATVVHVEVTRQGRREAPGAEATQYPYRLNKQRVGTTRLLKFEFGWAQQEVTNLNARGLGLGETPLRRWMAVTVGQ